MSSLSVLETIGMLDPVFLPQQEHRHAAAAQFDMSAMPAPHR
jgi:hypothetical protein